jgi:hypothetical protein
MNNVSQTIQQRNNLSPQQADHIENVLRSFSQRQMSEQQAAQQLRSYVPNQAGMNTNDLLSIIIALLAGQNGQNNIGNLIGRFLGNGSSGGGDIGSLIGNFLGSPAPQTQQPSAGLDLPGIVNNLLNNGRIDKQQTPPQQPAHNGVFDLINHLLD